MLCVLPVFIIIIHQYIPYPVLRDHSAVIIIVIIVTIVIIIIIITIIIIVIMGIIIIVTIDVTQP